MNKSAERSEKRIFIMDEERENAKELRTHFLTLRILEYWY